jgi:tRNA uridine 5-carbamoylmethylation protein Kti12
MSIDLLCWHVVQANKLQKLRKQLRSRVWHYRNKKQDAKAIIAEDELLEVWAKTRSACSKMCAVRKQIGAKLGRTRDGAIAFVLYCDNKLYEEDIKRVTILI